MKTSVYVLAFINLFMSFTANATTRTVSNAPNSPGQYTTISAAANASAAGDTIYVHGSTTSYGNITLTKRLVLLGTGHNPDKQLPFTSHIDMIYFDTIAFTSGSSGCIVKGFILGTGWTDPAGGANNIKNITLERNYISSNGQGSVNLSVRGSGWKLINNIITNYVSIDINNSANLLISNNIIDGTIKNSNQTSVLIANNVFHGDGSAGAWAIFNTSNAIISNNIFFRRHPDAANVTSCIFSNNITYQSANNNLPYGTNTGSGNINATDPEFANVAGLGFSYSNNYQLQNTSPGKNTGNDGTDIGIYGGGYPLVDMTGSPSIPQMKAFTINTAVIPQNGTLNIYFKAKKQN